MDPKTLQTLEYFKILERLANYCAFAASADKARALRPTASLEEAQQRLTQTSEAVKMLVTRPDLTIGGARDVRAQVDLAAHGGVLAPTDLLDLKSTLIAARTLARTFERLGTQFPTLSEIASRIPTAQGLVDNITRAISDRAEILDSASEKLNTIRRQLRITHDRLLTKLQRMVADPRTSMYLQEALITQRDGRYVLPLRAEFKGRIKAVVHDQSSSGATLFVEPLSVVEGNNEFRELQLAERDEERRILAELSAQVGMQAASILLAIDLIAELDLCFAKAKYSDDLAASEPLLHAIPKTSQGHPGTIIRLYQARHPLLDQASVVSIDVELDAADLRPGGHRPQHRRQDGHAENGRPAGADGAVRAAHPGPLRLGDQPVQANLRRHRRRAVHRAVALHLLRAHHQHHPHPGARRPAHAGHPG